MTEGPRRPLLAVLGLMLGPAVALGLARFAYALVLPAMREQLGWSFATAGALNTANALGYLAGAPLAAVLARRCGERRAFGASIAVTAAALLASAASGSVPVLLVLRAVAGVSGAVCFVVGAGLVAQAGRTLARPRAVLLLGVYFAGGGTGIVVSGLAVPPVLAVADWRVAWLLLGGLGVLSLAGALPAARAVPDTAPGPGRAGAGPIGWGRLWALLVCYGLFGAGYIAYMTFIVAALTADGATRLEVGAFWVVLGATATAAGFGWARVLPAWPPGRGLAVLLGLLAVATTLPVLVTGPVAALASALLFGAAFLTVVTAVTAAAQRTVPPARWTGAIATLTVIFALGQCLGPLLSGALSDRPGGVRAGLALGAGLLALAAASAGLHDPVSRAGRSAPE